MIRRFFLWGLLLVVVISLGIRYGIQQSKPMPEPPIVVFASGHSELQKAVDAAREEIQQNPNSAQAWAKFGWLLRSADRRNEAQFCYLQAMQCQKEEPRWPYLLGESYLPAQPEQALPGLRQAVDLLPKHDPENIAPRLRLAETLYITGEIQQAREQLRIIQQIDPDSPMLHYLFGQLAWFEEDATTALKHWKRCEQHPMTRRKTAIQLAALYARMGDVEKAQQCNQRVEELTGDQPFPDPYLLENQKVSVHLIEPFQQIEALEQQGERRKAVQRLTEMVQQTADVRAYVGLGKNLIRLGDWSGAEQALATALRIDPNGANAHFHMGELYWAQAEQNKDKPEARSLYKKAVSHLQESIRLHALDGQKYQLLGRCQRQLGNTNDALIAYRLAVQRDLDRTELLLEWIDLLIEEKQVEEAKIALQQAERLLGSNNPKIQQFKRLLGM